MFSHQELALAHHLGFRDGIIALQQEGSEKLQGFSRYILSNPEPFNTTDELLEKVEKLVSNKAWSPNFSRNLVVEPTSLTRTEVIVYTDHTGQALQQVWQIKIENRRPDLAAVGVVCVLD